MLGSISEDFGMIGRRTENLEKSSLNSELGEYTGTLCWMYTEKWARGVFDKEEAVDHAEHDPCGFSLF